jgi:hypothetical protein
MSLRRAGGVGADDIGEGQPHAVYNEVSDVGKKVSSSKKRAVWRFTFGEDGDEHEVVLTHSALSGKKKLMVDGSLIFESQKVASFEWSHGWAMGRHACRCDIRGEGNYDLTIDAVPYRRWPRVDPHLAAQLRAAKADSQRTLRDDEERRRDSLDKESKEIKAALGASQGRRESTGKTRRPSGSSSAAALSSSLTLSATQEARKDRRRSSSKPVPASPPKASAAIPDILSDQLPEPPAQVFNSGSFDPLTSKTAAGASMNDSAAILQLGMQFESMGMTFPQQQQQQQAQHAAGDFAGADGAHPPPSPVVNAPSDPSEHRRQNTLDKDLWQVAAEKDFVNINDLNNVRKKIEVKPLTRDQRSLAELAANPSSQSKTAVMMQPPPQMVQTQAAQQPVQMQYYYGGMPGQQQMVPQQMQMHYPPQQPQAYMQQSHAYMQQPQYASMPPQYAMMQGQQQQQPQYYMQGGGMGVPTQQPRPQQQARPPPGNQFTNAYH